MKRRDETYAERLEDITIRCFRRVNTLNLKAQHVISVICMKWNKNINPLKPLKINVVVLLATNRQ